MVFVDLEQFQERSRHLIVFVDLKKPIIRYH